MEHASGGIAPHNLNLCTRWRWVVKFINWLLCLCRKSPWNAMATWLGEY